MIVGFTGTRLGPTPTQKEAMRRFLTRIPITRFIHGGARNCDTIAHYIVGYAHPECPIEVYPADRDQGSIVTLPDGLTLIHAETMSVVRNKIFVRAIDGLLAVPRTDIQNGSNTWSVVRCAQAIGCPVYVVQQSGRIVRA